MLKGLHFIGETVISVQERIKEHDRDIRLARTQTSAVLGRANHDRDSHSCTRKDEEAAYIYDFYTHL